MSAQIPHIADHGAAPESVLWLRASELVQKAQAAPSVVNMAAAVDAWRAWERRSPGSVSA